MATERILTLLVGALAIGFGLMLTPYANALRRRMLSKDRPSIALTVTHGVPRAWRNHILPLLFIVLGMTLLAAGLIA